MQRFGEADLAATESVEIDDVLEEVLADEYISPTETLVLIELRRTTTYPHKVRMQGVAECLRVIVRLARVCRLDRNVIARLVQEERYRRTSQFRQRKSARTGEIPALEQLREAA